jgi:Zn finger protein HypA/HybF involved in hydrogenase expression
MGTLYEFKCPACGYSAEVSGGDDVGMNAVTTTVSCKTCKKLFDAVISQEPWAVVTFDEPGRLLDPGFKVEIYCNKSRRHKVESWTFPGPCPRCGTIMEKGQMLCKWD